MDAIELEVMVHALAGIAEEMMARLVRAAYSSNIKERRDCSTALFDGRGRLVAQAAAIPVHLGALGDAVAAVRAMAPRPGEIWLLNDPFAGGSHLPDLTLVTAIAWPDRPQELLGYAISRAHHSDVGGMRPGSMPADSTEIFQEGLVIPPTRSGAAGALDENVLGLILANVRQPAQRRGDLRAQLAAGQLGAERFARMGTELGADRLADALDAVIAYTERRVRERIAAIPDGTYRATDYLEGPEGEEIPIQVAVEIGGDGVRIDFTGTASQGLSNLNAPVAVTRSAVAFALRALLDPRLPANDGAMAPVELVLPEASLVAARWPAAVVAGNVETSQRIADALILALGGVAGGLAQGQGTMNNLILGNRRFSYYETIGGGQGASARGDGLDGVHVGMSNTLNTPIEALELEFPLTVRRYELREDSGGGGLHRGGWGIVREVQVHEDCTLSLLSDRRTHAPQGTAGGAAGRPGHNRLNGEPLPGKTSRALKAGDVITVETPGGGGWGK
ncbi:MAG: hydantoinase B/oxoprolinase family protein [Aphanocapsa lilacina HA4352-LM1]|jgi:N-methylhydantoinase B|nr:hydantoinase B/oxoprolinase family protein [Aphanocapsa lilacina HA4352-LM1]